MHVTDPEVHGNQHEDEPQPGSGLKAGVPGVLPWGGAFGLPIHAVRFDAGVFAPARFATAGIACPAPVARSVIKRQAEYFHGRLCARAALGQSGTAGCQVGTGPMGEPVWPPGMVGSITHTRGMAACAVSPAAQLAGLGIDLEVVGDDTLLDTVGGVVVSERELQRLREGGRALGLAVTLVFSAKEAFYKGIFGLVQRFVDFTALDVLAIDFESGLIHCRITEALHPRLPCDAKVQIEFTLLDDHVLTLFRCPRDGTAPATAAA